MNKTHIICSVQEDLSTLDKASLRMNNILITDSIHKALAPIMEGEAFTLLVTDKLIDTESGSREVSKLLSTVISLNKDSVRVIYIKRDINEDEISHLMDINGMWDVYFNREIRYMPTEEIIDILNIRKVRERRFTDKQIEGHVDLVKKNANAISNSLIDAMRINSNLENNDRFKGIVLNNFHLIRDLVLGYEQVKKELALSKKDNQQKDTHLDRLKFEAEQSSLELQALNNMCRTIEQNYNVALSTLQNLDTKYNTLYKTIDNAFVAEQLASNLSEALDADEYIDYAPTVLYLKEVTPIRYITDFVQSLSNIAIDSLKILSKVLVVENDFRINKLPLYEKKGFVYVTKGTPMDKIVLGNHIVIGNNKKLLVHLMQNALKLGLLIILDRTGSSQDLIEGSNVIKFSLVKSLQEAEDLGLESSTVITNDPNGEFVLEHIPDYEKISNNYDLRLSSVGYLKITRKLLVFIRDWETISIPREVTPLIEDDYQELKSSYEDSSEER